MTLRERLERKKSDEAAALAQSTGLQAATPWRAADHAAHGELKARIHRSLLDRLDLQQLDVLNEQQIKSEVRNITEDLLVSENVLLNDEERRNLVRDIQYEMLGLGPLELLMSDPAVSDILVNGSQQVYVERRGRLELTDVRFTDDAHLMKIIDKIVSRLGRRVDESSPMVDARLPDGSRVNVIIPPVAIDGPSMSIRRFSKRPLTMDDFIRHQSLTAPMAQLLSALAQAKVNILISGGTGSGKTTILNILSGFVSHSERVVTIEDAAELQLQQPHVVRLESRPANIEGNGEVSQRSLLKNALRMRPDRIILGEVRGAEAVDMLQAMNSGHEGSLATIHANTPRDALLRLENMMGLNGLNLPPRVARHQISSAITAVLQVARLSDGKRRMISIQEITGMEGDVIGMQEIYAFRQTGVATSGMVQGHFCATGVRPKFCDRLRAHGIELPDDLFDPSRLHPVTV